MGKKVDPREFLLNTDYEMDKIIYFKSGSLNANQQIDVSHNLGFTPLLFGVCAFNSDFTDPRGIPYEYTTQGNRITFDARSFSNKITLAYDNFAEGAPKMYYRLYGFEPSDSHAKVGATSKYSKQFILNTDYNYCKLCKKGTLPGSDTQTVNHNLGYIPQVLVWGESSYGTSIIDHSNGWNDPMTNLPFGVAVTNKQLITKYPGLTAFNKIHYRIYYDEA